MYKCGDCGAIFEEPRITIDKVPYGDAYVDYPSGEECPHCGSDFFDEVEKCKICGEYMDGHYGLCEDCYAEVEKEMQTLVNKLKAHGVDLSILDDLVERMARY